MSISLLVLVASTAGSVVNGDLPRIVIDTHGAVITDGDKVLSDLSIASSDTDFQGHCGIRLRGHSSLTYPRKSYTIEIWDAAGNDVKPDQPLLGFPIDEDYVLHGPFADRTSLRNYFTYTLERTLGRWAPRARFVLLTMNGSDDGLYVFIEKIKRDKDRVDVDKDDPAIADRGYVFADDKLEPGEPQANTFHSGFAFVYPKEPTELQSLFLERRIEDFFTAISQGGDPWLGYPRYIDVMSFHDEWLLQQLAYNTDAFITSSYFYKDTGGKINAGPLWDIDLGYGTAPLSDAGIDAWLPMRRPWWVDLMADPTFVRGLVARWRALRQGPLQTPQMLSIIDEVVPEIRDAAEVVAGTVVDWDEAVTHMKLWITARATWMDDNIEALKLDCTPDCAVAACGWDGCGGSCGGCVQGQECFEGACRAPCYAVGCPLPVLYLYRDDFENDFTPTDWSVGWASEASTFGTGTSIVLDCGAAPQLTLDRRAAVSASYDRLRLSLRAEDPADVLLTVSFDGEARQLQGQLVAGQWREVTIPLDKPLQRATFMCSGAMGKVWIDEIAALGSLVACECDGDPLTTEACTGDSCVLGPTPDVDPAAPDPGPDEPDAEVGSGAEADPSSDAGPVEVLEVEAVETLDETVEVLDEMVEVLETTSDTDAVEPQPDVDTGPVEPDPDTGRDGQSAGADDLADAPEATTGADVFDTVADSEASPDEASLDTKHQVPELPQPPSGRGCGGAAAESWLSLFFGAVAWVTATMRRRRALRATLR